MEGVFFTLKYTLYNLDLNKYFNHFFIVCIMQWYLYKMCLKKVMNHFSYYLRHISKQAPSYIQISNHIFEKYSFWLQQ